MTQLSQTPPNMDALQKNIQKLTEINKQALDIGVTTEKQSKDRSEKINEIFVHPGISNGRKSILGINNYQWDLELEALISEKVKHFIEEKNIILTNYSIVKNQCQPSSFYDNGHC